MIKFISHIIILACLTAVLGSCKVNPAVSPPDDNVYVTLAQTSSFLSFCEEMFENEEKPILLVITVQGATGDPNNPGTITFEREFEVSNDRFSLLQNNYAIEVPSSGTFQLIVSLMGFDCFSCCSDVFTVDEYGVPTNQTGCPDPLGGRPRWDHRPITVNKKPGEPEFFTVMPQLRSCSFCQNC